MTDFLVQIILVLCSIAVLCWASLTKPGRWVCPDKTHNMGIRPSGHFCCHYAPVGDPDYDGTFGKPDRSVRPPGELCGRIYCTGGSVPIVVSDRIVGCQR